MNAPIYSLRNRREDDEYKGSARDAQQALLLKGVDGVQDRGGEEMGKIGFAPRSTDLALILRY